MSRAAQFTLLFSLGLHAVIAAAELTPQTAVSRRESLEFTLETMGRALTR